MKHVILSPVRVKNHRENVDNTSTHQAPIDESLMDESFDNPVYDVSYDEVQEVKNTDNFDKYTIASEHYMTLKEARVSKEIKTPFAVIKARGKRSKASEYDNIYRTDKKIKYKQYRQQIRLGFIRGADEFKYSNVNLDKNNKLVGLLNEEIPIRKKKGFNQKTVGFMKIAEGTESEDYYVEVTKSRSILNIILTALIVTALAILLNGHDWSDWHFNPDNLTAYKAIATEFTEEELMIINHRGTIGLDDDILYIGFISVEVPNRQFKMKVYAGDNADGILLYESEQLAAGAAIEDIRINNASGLESGIHNCTVICDIYNDFGGYLGSLESHFTLRK